MRAEKKPILGLERVKLAEVVPLRTPFTLNIFPTNICNFRCKYCVQSLGANELREQHDFYPDTMEYDLFVEIVRQAREFPDKFKLLSMMGHGEPLCHKDLPNMIAYAKEKAIAERIEVITNGSLLTRDKSLALIEAGLDTLRISLQGLSTEKYRQISGVALDFEELVDNIKFFYQNRKDCKVFVKIANIALDPGEEEVFYQIFGNISDRIFVENIMPVYSDVDYENMLVSDNKYDRYGRFHEERHVCPLCFYMFGIWPNGDTAPCDAFNKPLILGNVKNDSLLNMWQGESLRQFRAMHLRKERGNHEKCKSCCAPDDVSQPEDVLDSAAEELLKLFV